jgi:hypothetical protein
MQIQTASGATDTVLIQLDGGDRISWDVRCDKHNIKFRVAFVPALVALHRGCTVILHCHMRGVLPLGMLHMKLNGVGKNDSTILV